MLVFRSQFSFPFCAASWSAKVKTNTFCPILERAAIDEIAIHTTRYGRGYHLHYLYGILAAIRYSSCHYYTHSFISTTSIFRDKAAVNRYLQIKTKLLSLLSHRHARYSQYMVSPIFTFLYQRNFLLPHACSIECSNGADVLFCMMTARLFHIHDHQEMVRCAD